jgi:ribonucleotide monophosphatase NagD (HAD superfamily)
LFRRGAILAAINAASGGQPTLIGKPSPLLPDGRPKDEVVPPDLLVVGDRLETDIAGGRHLPNSRRLSGVSTREQALAWSPPPTIIADDLSDVLGL